MEEKERFAFLLLKVLLFFFFSATNIASKNANNSQCVAQFIGQHYTQSDLDEFFLLYDRQNVGERKRVEMFCCHL